MRLLRRLLGFLFVAAYIGAASLAPVMYADSPDMSSSMLHPQGSHGTDMPCKGMKHGCFSGLGCVFLVSLPAPDVTLFTTMNWAAVAYTDTPEALRGRSLEPALGPPISHV